MDESKREAGDDEGEFSKLLRVLEGFSKVTIVRVHGAAYGIALGLIAACDIAVASVETDFCASEVKFGFVSPLSAKYLSRELGIRGARRILLCGEVFSAAEAYRLGLVHELATLENLDTAVNEILGHLVVGSPYAQMSTKRILNLLRREEGEEELLAMVSNKIGRAHV